MDALFCSEAKKIKEKLEAVRGESSLVFTLFSDLHTRSREYDKTNRLCEALSVLCEEIKPDAVIDLGDNLAMLGREEHITNDRLVLTLTEIFDKIKDSADCPLFLINGNHDAVGTDFFKSWLWNGVVQGKYDGGLASYSKTGSYYYVDYANSDVRLVFISLPYDSDTDAKMPTPLWMLGKEQILWLKDVALNTEKDVLLFSHVPLYYEYMGDKSKTLAVWNGERAALSTISSLCGWIEDRNEAADVINSKGNVIACFSGHTHRDAMWEPFEERGAHKNPLACRQIITREPMTKDNDIAIDVLVYSPKDKSCSMLRFGEGEDRRIN